MPKPDNAPPASRDSLGAVQHSRAIGVVATYAICSGLVLWPLPVYGWEAVWGSHAATWSLMWAFNQPDPMAAYAIIDDAAAADAVAVLWSGRLIRLGGLSLPATLNLLLLLGIWAAGLSAHALGRALSGSHWGGFLAGGVFVSGPIFAQHAASGQTEPVLAWLLPTVAWSTITLLRSRKIRDSMLLGSVLILAGLAGVWLLSIASIIVLFLVAWHAIDTRRPPSPSTLMVAGVSATISVWMARDVVAPSIPNVAEHAGGMGIIGWLAPGVAVLGAATAGRRGTPWLALALIGAALWYFDGVLPLYYSNGEVYLSLTAAAALSASGFAVLRRSVPRASTAGAVLLSLFALIQAVFALPPARRTALTPAPTAADVPSFAFASRGEWLDLPYLPASRSLAGARATFRQTLHQQPLFTKRSPTESPLGVNDFPSLATSGVGFAAVRTRVPMDEAIFQGGFPAPELLIEPMFSAMQIAFSSPVAERGGIRLYAVASLDEPPAVGAVESLTSALDYSAFHLPVVLEADGSLRLFDGPARQFSVWLSAEREGTLAIRIRSEGKSRVVPLTVEKDVWVWHAIPITESTPVTITAEATNARIEFRFTSAQVLL